MCLSTDTLQPPRTLATRTLFPSTHTSHPEHQPPHTFPNHPNTLSKQPLRKSTNKHQAPRTLASSVHQAPTPTKYPWVPSVCGCLVFWVASVSGLIKFWVASVSQSVYLTSSIHGCPTSCHGRKILFVNFFYLLLFIFIKLCTRIATFK